MRYAPSMIGSIVSGVTSNIAIAGIKKRGMVHKRANLETKQYGTELSKNPRSMATGPPMKK